MSGSPDTSPQAMDFEGWMTRLVHDHRGLLARVARHEGLAPEDALDVVQDAFVTFMHLPDARALVDEPETREASRKLLVAVTRNLARNHRRLHAVARPHVSEDGTLVDDTPGADTRLEGAEALARLEVCVARLATRERLVVVMRLFDDAGGDEVARTLGISAGHVAVLLHRAKASLCACMRDPVVP
jgi:RNA polymerase sigma-70 factor, ECF subfamily